MEQVRFKLEIFEGPMDLLLHLVEKNKLDILDIPIAELLEQYMEYVDDYKKRNVEELSSFLYMASELMYIKSRLLLPKEEPDEEDPRQPLVDMLLEYQKYKAAAREFGGRFQRGSACFVREFPEALELGVEPYQKKHDPEVLHRAYQRVQDRNRGTMPPSFTAFTNIVSTKVVPVGSKAISILRKLCKRGKVLFSSLFKDVHSRSEIVATFLAVLELSKKNRVELGDGEDCQIILRRGE